MLFPLQSVCEGIEAVQEDGGEAIHGILLLRKPERNEVLCERFITQLYVKALQQGCLPHSTLTDDNVMLWDGT